MNLWATAGNGPVKYPVIRAKTDRVDVEVIEDQHIYAAGDGVLVRPHVGRGGPSANQEG